MSFNERAFALGKRTEGLVGRQRRQYLVVVPGILGLAGRLDLDEKHIVRHSPVLSDSPSSREEIIDRHFAHLGKNGLGLRGTRRLDRFQVMRDGGKEAGMGK